MELNFKYVIVGALVIAAVGFGSGRLSAPEKVKIQIQTVEVEKKTDKKQEDTAINNKKDRKYLKTTTETVAPDGTKTVTSTTKLDTFDHDTSDSKSTDVAIDQEAKESTQSKEVTYKKSPLNLGLMVGPDLSHGFNSSTMLYGGYINKALIGPITTGIFGFSNGTVGFSLGLSL